jgi:beta-glucosidase
VGAAIGAEAAAGGKDVLLAPTLNVLHHPRWGRAQESYGEEPAVLGAMASAFLQGAQRHVLATAKHFAANSIEETRYEVDVQIDERTLREVYLPHFRMAVRQGGAAFVMSAYNRVNGDYCGENEHLLSDILKGEWGFSGVVMSDWIWGLTDGAEAIGAGLDLEMPYADQTAGLAARVEAGEVSLARVDDAVRRHLRLALAEDAAHPAPPDPSVVRSDAHREVALRAARASMVLLENDGALPIASGARLVVVGALADEVNTGDRGSSNVPSAVGVVTPAAGLSARWGDAVDVLASDELGGDDLARVRQADVAVVVAGLSWRQEGEGIFPADAADRDDLALPAAHIALVEAVAATGTPVVLVLQGSGPVDLRPVRDRVRAVVMSWYAGQEGGRALAELLAGDADFEGRLPMVWPEDEAQLPTYAPSALSVTYGPLHGWRWMEEQGLQPAYPFGFGRSYDAATIRVTSAPETWVADAPWTVRGVTDRPTVVQVYVRPAARSVQLAPRVLAGFARADGDFEIALDPRWLAHWDEGGAGWQIEEGRWWIDVATSAADVVESVPVRVVAP